MERREEGIQFSSRVLTKKVQDLGFDTQYHTHTDFNRMPASGQLVMLNVTFLL